MKKSLFVATVLLLAGRGVSWASPPPVVVPLINFNGTGQLGINVLIGNNPTPHTYILDTGSAGFATAMGTGPSWTGSNFTVTGNTFHLAYGDGSLQYDGNVSIAKVTLSNTNGDALKVINNATLGIITNQPYPNWNTEIDSDPAIAPESPTSHQFFGTVGAGLYKTTSGNMTSILGQASMPGLKHGYVIHTGGINSSSATLTLGLTDEEIASFPIIVPMNASTGTFLSSTGVTVNLYPEFQVSANYTFLNGNATYSSPGSMIIDSGGLGTHYATNDSIPGAIDAGGVMVPGTDFMAMVEAAGGNTSLDWAFLAGTTDYVDRVTFTSAAGGNVLNTGIAIYYQYDVMFDTEDGLVGFRPVAVPEPGTYALAAGLAGLALAGWVKRRRG